MKDAEKVLQHVTYIYQQLIPVLADLSELPIVVLVLEDYQLGLRLEEIGFGFTHEDLCKTLTNYSDNFKRFRWIVALRSNKKFTTVSMDSISALQKSQEESCKSSPVPMKKRLNPLSRMKKKKEKREQTEKESKHESPPKKGRLEMIDCLSPI
jgi:hypothetical protein